MGKFGRLRRVSGQKPAGIWLPGRVRVKLYKGNTTIVGRESPNSLYSMKVVTFEEDQGAYDQFDAQGFIKLNALRLRLGAMAGRKGGAL